MIYRVIFIILFALLLLLSGCSSNSTGRAGSGINSASVLGLTEDRSLEYFQIDTTITYVPDTTGSHDPSRDVHETAITRTFTIAQVDDSWIVSDGNGPLLNLIISGNYVLHNGYYASPSPDLIYFQVPSILMVNSPEPEEAWASYTEPYLTGTDTLVSNAYFAYFGFHSEKWYVAQEEIFVPAGAYQVHRFEVDLFATATDSIPIAHATEYYATDLGLVKLRFEDYGFIRTLVLIRSY